MMVRPLSLDLRTRVAAALNDGMTVRVAAERFGISAATAVRIGQLDRSGKGLMPAKIGGYVQPILRGAAADAVCQRLQIKPNWTVRALSAELKAAGIDVSHDTVRRFLRAEGKTFKRTPVAGERDRPKVPRFRMRWKTHQHRLDPDRLALIDETWVKTNMTRTCGWCQRGEHVALGNRMYRPCFRSRIMYRLKQAEKPWVRSTPSASVLPGEDLAGSGVSWSCAREGG